MTVRYWAGARAAAGVESEQVTAGTVADALAAARANHAGLGEVIDRSSILLDGRRVAVDRLETPVAESAVIEILPPFAGG